MKTIELWRAWGAEYKRPLLTYASVILGFSTAGNAIGHDWWGALSTAGLAGITLILRRTIAMHDEQDRRDLEDKETLKRFDRDMEAERRRDRR